MDDHTWDEIMTMPLLNYVMGQVDSAADQFTDGTRNRDLVTRTAVILSPSLLQFNSSL